MNEYKLNNKYIIDLNKFWELNSHVYPVYLSSLSSFLLTLLLSSSFTTITITNTSITITVATNSLLLHLSIYDSPNISCNHMVDITQNQFRTYHVILAAPPSRRALRVVDQENRIKSGNPKTLFWAPASLVVCIAM